MLKRRYFMIMALIPLVLGSLFYYNIAYTQGSDELADPWSDLDDDGDIDGVDLGLFGRAYVKYWKTGTLDPTKNVTVTNWLAPCLPIQETFWFRSLPLVNETPDRNEPLLLPTPEHPTAFWVWTGTAPGTWSWEETFIQAEWALEPYRIEGEVIVSGSVLVFVAAAPVIARAWGIVDFQRIAEDGTTSNITSWDIPERQYTYTATGTYQEVGALMWEFRDPITISKGERLAIHVRFEGILVAGSMSLTIDPRTGRLTVPIAYPYY